MFPGLGRPAEDEDYEPRSRRGRRRSLSRRLAWGVLATGALLIIARASLATVVQIHGDGMAPTIIDGDHVMLVRGAWGLQRGDIVVYSPAAPEPRVAEEVVVQVAQEPPRPGEREQGARHADPQRAAREALRNTAVIDVEDLGFDEDDWRQVQSRTGVEGDRPQGVESVEEVAPDRTPPRALRVGRVIALPGDTVTFNVPGGAMGLAINGRPLRQKPSPSLRLPPQPGDASDGARVYASALEQLDDTTYQVLIAHEPSAPQWVGLDLPGDAGPIEMEAEGYLVLADHREDGACCDSRKLGWIAKEQLRGELVLRLGRRPTTAAEGPPEPGVRWLP